ncbi:MAG: hypothetical protein RL459_1579, partial [Pseudomonadota bacterium]
MITFYNPIHAQHQGRFEMFRGQLVPCFEVPARQDLVLAELRRRGLGEVQMAERIDAPALGTIHSPQYLDFLAHAW